MRVLNTNIDPRKKFRRFSLPGFRSGSTFKKVIALLYYFSVIAFMTRLTIEYSGGDFKGAGDVLILALIELSLLCMFLTPVVLIGLSNHYDWHGIKLFIIVMVPVCLFSTLGQWLGTYFSKQYIESVNPSEKQIQQLIDSDAQSSGEIVVTE